MSQKIKQASIAGRIGSGIGRGLSEQIPKEIDRYRLASGLEDISNQKGLTPFQQFAKLSSVPGITPQMVQSGAELLRQQGIGEGLGKVSDQANNRPQQSPLDQYRPQPNQTNNKQGVTTPESTQAAIQNYIPRNREQLLQRAYELKNENPQLYPTAQDAINGAAQEDAANRSQSEALQGQRTSQQGVQDRAERQIDQQINRLGVEVPGNVREEIRQKVLDDIKNGKTEEQATRDAGKELDRISRDYKALETVGATDYMIRDKGDIKRNLRQIREDFKKRNDLENLADTYISKNGLSPGKAYYLAYPPSEIKELNNELVKLPDVNAERKRLINNTNKSFEEVDKQIRNDSEGMFEKLAKAMGKDGSPLSIGEELKSKGYSSDDWLDYLGRNRKRLDLSERQGRELGKPKNFLPTLNDNWLFFSSGLDKLVEQ